MSPRLLRGRRWRIKTYVLLLVALFVGVAAAAAIYVDVQTGRDGRSAALADARFAAEAAAGQLGQAVTVLRATVDNLASNPQIEAAATNPDCTLTFTSIGGADASHLDILGADGRVLCTSRPRSSGPQVNYAGEAWFRRARERQVLVAPTTDFATGANVAIDAQPTPGRRVVVAGFVDLTRIGPALVDLYGGGDPVSFLVTTADGTVLARSVDPSRWIGRTLAGTPFARRTGTERDDLDGRPRLFAETPVPGTDWRFYAGQDAHAALAAAHRLERRQLEIIVAGLIVALLGAWFVHRQLVQPIRRLGDAVRAATGGPVPAEVPVEGPAEVLELGERVNGLIASVNRELRERERAEGAEAATARSYRMLFEQNPNAMWVYDAETLRFLAVNDAAVAAYGYARDEFLAMTIGDIRPPEDVAALYELVRGDELDRGLNPSGVWRHIRRDGTIVDVEITSHEHTFEGRPARVVLALDVT